MNTKIKKVAELLLLELINDNDTYFRLSLTENADVAIYHDTYRGKLNVSITHSKNANLSYNDIHQTVDLSISMTANKSAEAIAKDIERRILDSPKIDDAVKEINEAVDRKNEYELKSASIKRDNKTLDIALGDKWKSHRQVIITEYGNVEINCDRLPVDLIIKICKMIDDQLLGGCI